MVTECTMQTQFPIAPNDTILQSKSKRQKLVINKIDQVLTVGVMRSTTSSSDIERSQRIRIMEERDVQGNNITS